MMPAGSRPSSNRRATNRQAVTAGALVVGALIVGAGAFLIREKASEQPPYTVTVSEGDFEIRTYPAMLVAETWVAGDRQAALNRGFGVLADYIFAKSRPGEQIAMTAPVLLASASSEATSDSATKGSERRWRTRFVMPARYARATLPSTPEGVDIEEVSERRVAAVRFRGRATDSLLEREELALREWLEAQNETDTGIAEFAFYNSPFVPGPLRRNEVLIALG